MSREKVKILNNGQWKLTKAWGTATYDAVDHGESPFGADQNKAHQAKTDLIDHVKTNYPSQLKTMKNLHTGKDEPHVLLHRGIGNNDGENPVSTRTGQNSIAWSGKFINSTHNSVHTLNKDQALGYAEGDAREDGEHGIAHSFWVPLSNIHGNEPSIDGEHNQSDAQADHVLIAPGKYRRHSSTTLHVDGKDEKGYIKYRPEIEHFTHDDIE